jgi:hypothetical protein
VSALSVGACNGALENNSKTLAIKSSNHKIAGTVLAVDSRRGTGYVNVSLMSATTEIRLTMWLSDAG